MPLTLRAKCIVVGDNGVGKTAVTQSLTSDGSQFPKSYTMGTGVDICVKAVQIPDTDVTVELFIYDCAGKDTFSDYVQQFWYNPSIMVVVYDVTNEPSFASCSKWLQRVVAQKNSPDSFLLGGIVANRIDLEDQRVIDSQKGEKFASDNSLDYFETSAKDHVNCSKPFLVLAEKFYRQYEENLDNF